MVVVALDRAVDRAGVGPLQRRVQRLFAARLADRARHADDARRRPVAPGAAQRLQRREAVRHPHMGTLARFGHDRARRALRGGLAEVAVAVGR